MEDTKPNASEQAQDMPNQAAPGDEQLAEIEALTAKLGEAEQAAAEARETLLRERADLENQRRRVQRDLDNARRFANEKLLGELLPVCDSLEQGLAVQGADVEALRQGMELTLRSLRKVAEGAGLIAVDPLHQPFDPERHQAMSMVESDQHEPNTVVSVMQKGYVLNDRLLRPALVAVAKAPGG
ncbi:nucleotide exchange factor GrpE [Oleiagrimonas sp. C23AA]|uniref:nucleotide exchange factor GrpE n=1 Tax=Oleiagrimonas sp. C23AA TaxID=2719047 RepID=UPI00141FBC3D|nr:nucleotide exchange factor GrpE [Oleiagrimonas sp. C23AA]NII10417.1 nucleotide exchange factor GrpE [Oleiagrimonas sp. C23AA]